MPRFDIHRTKKEPPRRGFEPINADVGAVGRALQKIGQAVSETAEKWDRAHADTRFSNAKRLASDRMGRQLVDELDAETDPEQYERIYNRSLQDVKGFRPDHPRAGRMYDLWFNEASPTWNKGFAGSLRARVIRNGKEAQAREKGENLAKMEALFLQIAGPENEWGEVESYIADTENQAFWGEKGIDQAEMAARLRHARDFKSVEDGRKAEQFKKDQRESIVNISKATTARSGGIADLDEALAAGYITDAEKQRHVKLRAAGTATTSDLVSRANVLRAVQAKNTGTITEKQALDVLYKHSKDLTSSDNTKFQEDIISVGDPSKGRSFTRAQSLMTDIIRDKDPLSGFFTDDEDQIVGDAQGTIQLNDDMATAAKAGKPMTENEMIIRSIEIGQQIKRDIKARKEQPTTRKVQGRTLGIRHTIEESIPESEIKKAPDLRLIPTPDGFENVWPKLGSADRQDVLKELETGTDPNEIIDHLERKPSE